MPGCTETSDTSGGAEDRTRSNVFKEAGRVGSVTYCMRAWSSIKSSNVFIIAAVDGLVITEGLVFQFMSLQLKSPAITTLG